MLTIWSWNCCGYKIEIVWGSSSHIETSILGRGIERVVITGIPIKYKYSTDVQLRLQEICLSELGAAELLVSSDLLKIA